MCRSESSIVDSAPPSSSEPASKARRLFGSTATKPGAVVVTVVLASPRNQIEGSTPGVLSMFVDDRGALKMPGLLAPAKGFVVF